MGDQAPDAEPAIKPPSRHLEELSTWFSRAQTDVNAALHIVETADASREEKVQMLMEIAIGLQTRPRSVASLHDAATLYRKAMVLCDEADGESADCGASSDIPLWRARLEARLATALQAVPDEGYRYLEEARTHLENALVLLRREGLPPEVAEAEMNLGLVIQGLAAFSAARLTDGIAAYQRSLRTFTREAYPTEFAVLHNNLATAYLSLPMSDERAKIREALAVQSFEEALRVVTLIDHPSEYAMLQNNLGNALQYASSAHMVANNLRAIEAYDEALKVRNERDMPVAYANTISNRANALRNVPDELVVGELSSGPNPKNLAAALVLFRRARELFAQHGELERAAAVSENIAAIDDDLRALSADRDPRGSPGEVDA